MTLDTKAPIVTGGVTPVPHPHPVPPELSPWVLAINHKWQQLGRPGNPIGTTVAVGNGHLQRYEGGGTIYADANLNTTFVYGKIGERYDQMGGPTSWLGFPTSDEGNMSEGGRVNTFQHGAIYFWGDTGAIELAGVIVHYTGLVCFGETDNPLWGSDSPYVTMGVVGPNSYLALRSQIYNGVNAGSGHPDLLEIYRGPPLGLRIKTVLTQHGSSSDPDALKKSMEDGAMKAAKWLEDEIRSVPLVGPTVADIAAPFIEKMAPIIADDVFGFLGLADSALGDDEFNFTAKDMVKLSARTPNSVDHGVGYKRETGLMSRQGASYKVGYGLIPMAP
ncbi:LGFP repeat-containing protein [Paraburkholderia sp. Cpub6]|uniref:LGFP repeat-containing protein n=1 Tax=Paraburkholderia sp. Cpub6 TaxID=2723094 RepID=UPI001613037F|nr:hypothetical protein [Paraburkholderia sp. Cpub6]MBB5463591.1 hypothetical protein [Paraburkholderia sp. Cpub6]